MLYFLVLLVCFCVQGYTQSNWQGKQADIYFLLDTSSSVWVVSYQYQLKFVANLVSDMDIGPSATRVGVGIFSDDFDQRIPLTNTYTREELEQQIVKIPKFSGNTFISRALRGMREQGLAPSTNREGVPRMVVLITDGESRHKQLTQDNATLAKADGIFIFTIGVGNGIDNEELRLIASDPKANYNFHVRDFPDLVSINDEVSRKMSEVEFLQRDEGSCGENTIVDTVFVFDESAIGAQHSKQIKEFIKSVSQEISMDSGNMRLGVVSKTCHEGDIVLGQYVNKADFAAGIEDDSGPGINSLVSRVWQTAFLPNNGARLNALRRIVLVLHSRDEQTDDLFRTISRAIYAKVQVFVIRVGTDYNKTQIDQFASQPTYAFYPGEINKLADLKSEFLKHFCEGL